MKEILLTKGFVALVDDRDYDKLSGFKWYANVMRNATYAYHRVEIEGKPTIIAMHTELLKPPTGMEVDHIDGNGLNNQRHNLRCVTHHQNQQNMHMKKSSRFCGVTWHKGNRKWMAHIHVGEKGKHLGYFETEDLAHEAYMDAFLELKGIRRGLL